MSREDAGLDHREKKAHHLGTDVGEMRRKDLRRIPPGRPQSRGGRSRDEGQSPRSWGGDVDEGEGGGASEAFRLGLIIGTVSIVFSEGRLRGEERSLKWFYYRHTVGN